MGDKLRGGTTIGGNIAYHAGNIPTWNQDTTGNAGTSTKLATARTIALSGDVSGSTSFDGSGNVSITTTVADDSHNHTFANLTSTPATATRWPTWSEVSSKPTTFAPSPHTHTVSQVTDLGTAATRNVGTGKGNVMDSQDVRIFGGSNSGISNPDSITSNTITYSTGTTATGLFQDGAIYAQYYAVGSYGHQIFGDYRSGGLAVRGLNNGVWTPWRQVYHTGNLPATPPTNLGITAGTTAGPIVTSSTGTNATLPTASATASGVVTTGAQTIAGVKTFSSAITGNITGNADTATKLSTTRANFKGITDSVVVGELMWKNFGNSHTIFDASNSTTPTGVAKNNTNPEIAWSATYPTLMGYNGNQTYGVRVDSSRYADQLKTARTINGVSFDGSANITISDSTKVALTGNETIAGIKTFSSSPVVPTPTTDTQAVNKAYVDSTTSTALPKGFIGMWSGSIATIPTGWVLCDGLNNTPNLVNRFVVGAGSTYAVGATGGSADAVVVSHSHTASTDSQGSHAHGAWTDSQGNHAHTTQGHVSANRFSYGGGGGTAGIGIPYSAAAETSVAGYHGHNVGIGEAGAHGHNIAVSTNGESGTNKNLPPYYALCYIMKT